MLRYKNSLQIRNIVLGQSTQLSSEIEGRICNSNVPPTNVGLHFVSPNHDLEASNTFPLVGVGTK